MGNRGCLHDHEGVIRRRWKERRWIICELSYKGHVVPLREPGLYTPLFFKDEASALAAGHRPCATCRRDDYKQFLRAVEAGKGLNPGSMNAKRLDDTLHEERLHTIDQRPSLTHDEIGALPDGAMVVAGRSPFVVYGGRAHAWSWQANSSLHSKLISPVKLLTPPTTVAAMKNGYQPETRAL